MERAIELLSLPWSQPPPAGARGASSTLAFLCVLVDGADDDEVPPATPPALAPSHGSRALLVVPPTDRAELDALTRHPLLRCLTPMHTPRALRTPSMPRLAWLLHAVPSALIALPEYAAWVASGALAGATHIYTPADAMPRPTPLAIRRAFTSSASQRATLRALLGRGVFPTADEMDEMADEIVDEHAAPLDVTDAPCPSACPRAVWEARAGSVEGLPMLAFEWSDEERTPVQGVATAEEDAPSAAETLRSILAHGDDADSSSSAHAPPSASLAGGAPTTTTVTATSTHRRDELMICMLGTGCAVPAKLRAPAAIYLHAYARGGILLDVGEGTLGQLCVLLGAARAAHALARLAAIWISHHHADHHLGLLRVLNAVHALRAPAAPPLLVVGPRAVGAFLDSYSRLLPLASRPRYRFESCGGLNAPRSCGRDWLLRESGLGLRTVRSVPVVHCADAWGIVLEHADGWSVVYSGDTRPCEALVTAGRNATLLIHEATFDDERAADAVQKRHSTRGEALDVAGRMGAYRTLLTHLSSRYRELHDLPSQTSAASSPDAPSAAAALGAAAAAAARTSLVAFDLMAINLADLDGLPAHMATLEHFLACEQRYLSDKHKAELAEQFERSERLEREAALSRMGVD